MKHRLFGKMLPALAALGMLFAFSCCMQQGKKGIYRTEALEPEAWDSSAWISVTDAPVVEGPVVDGTRAADRASWFVSTVTNGREVSRVCWMTSALGVYEIYVNGKLVGR